MIALPPYAGLLGLTAAPQPEGPPLLHMPFGEAVLGRPGFLHGGAITGLLEVAAIVALRHALDEAGTAARIKPVNLTVDFVRGGRERLTVARGVVTRLGNRLANVDATAWQDDPARPIAAARMHWMVRRDG
jgi:uncharacterized protein (TIGR00369 family)